MSAPELKPCPFCGGPAELISPASGGNPYVMCIRNYCTQPHVECVTAWNTRTDTILSDPRVKALVEALQVTAGVLQSERTRSGGQQFTGVWSMPSIGRRVTVSEALDEADAALAALKGAT